MHRRWGLYNEFNVEAIILNHQLWTVVANEVLRLAVIEHFRKLVEECRRKSEQITRVRRIKRYNVDGTDEDSPNVEHVNMGKRVKMRRFCDVAMGEVQSMADRLVSLVLSALEVALGRNHDLLQI